MRLPLDDAVDRHAEHAFGLLADLVAAPSTVGHEQAALGVLEAELVDLGLDVARLPFPAGPLDDPRAGVTQPGLTSSDRFQLLGRTPGPAGLSLLLNGHMDVVPALTPHLWTNPPFTPTRRDGRLHGRGAGDMKGGFAMGCLALRALRDTEPELLDDARLGMLAVVEEECTGNGTIWSAARDGVLADAVVLLEPTDLDVLVAGVGVLWVDVEVLGVSAHAESAHLAVNPIDLGMALVEGLRAWCADLAAAHPDPALADVPSPYNLNLGGVQSGDWHSSVPASAMLRLRVGYPRAWTLDEAEQRVRAEVAELASADPRFTVTPSVRAAGLRARGYALDAGHPLVAALTAAHVEAHGRTPRAVGIGSTTDARTYLNDHGVPAVCFGAVAHDIHGIDESVDLASIVDGARTLARFMSTWLRRDRDPDPDLEQR